MSRRRLPVHGVIYHLGRFRRREDRFQGATPYKDGEWVMLTTNHRLTANPDKALCFMSEKAAQDYAYRIRGWAHDDLKPIVSGPRVWFHGDLDDLVRWLESRP